RRRSHRIARRVLRRSEPTRFSSASDDKVGGFSSAIRSERQRAIKQRKDRLRSLLLSTAARDFPTLAAHFS
ncbi:MAG TPA: hypothetical protein VFO20_12320, partial [Propionibacteriaceae bacterium]|nr:hypothetical protein [Propionibacteriaceae bacterium]